MAWSLDPTIMTGLVLLAGLYFTGQVSLARRAGRVSPLQRRRIWAFIGALVTLVAALLSPLETLSEQFFLPT